MIDILMKLLDIDLDRAIKLYNSLPNYVIGFEELKRLNKNLT